MSDTTMTRRPRGTDWAMILLVYLISMLGASALSRSGTRVGNVAAAPAANATAIDSSWIRRCISSRCLVRSTAETMRTPIVPA